ncbi:MAG: hypothetical protein HY280_07640 [Nitrospinae bacterium]|nr:hypothetical protein [Nitrospinota bacterium]
MEGGVTFEILAHTLERCGVLVELRNLDDEDIIIKGGLCEMGGKKYLIVDERLGDDGRIQTALDALKTLNLEEVFVPPAIREMLGHE